MSDGSLPPERNGQLDPVNVLEVAVDSPAIRRLIEEVRAEETDVSRSYNRTFNRHNR